MVCRVVYEANELHSTLFLWPVADISVLAEYFLFLCSFSHLPLPSLLATDEGGVGEDTRWTIAGTGKESSHQEHETAVLP